MIMENSNVGMYGRIGARLVSVAAGAVALGCLSFGVPSARAAVFTPISVALSGSIADVVVPANATAGTSPNAYTSYYTQSIDGGSNVFYEAGLSGSPAGIGLPAGGSFTSSMGNGSFQFQPYTANNAIVGVNNLGSGTFTLNQPGIYSSLAILGTGGGGDAGNVTTLTFASNITVATDIYLGDWFSGQASGTTSDGNAFGIALDGFNRLNGQTGVFDTAYQSNEPRLYQTDLNLADLTGYLDGSSNLSFGLDMTADTLLSVTVQRVDSLSGGSNGRPVVMAISGAAVPEPGSLFIVGVGSLGLLAGRRFRSVR